MKKLKGSGKSWIGESLRIFLLIALAVVIGNWIAAYTSPSLTQRIEMLEKQHEKICEYFGAECG